jgi:hypothetical protein
MRERRIVWAVGALIAVLAAAFLLTARTAPQSGALIFTYSSVDAGPGGVLALRRWLAALGYETQTVQGSRFAVSDEIDLLFVLGPTELVPPEDVTLLKDWVTGGKTLVIASDRGLLDDALFGGFATRLATRQPGQLDRTISPALSRPPTADLRTDTSWSLVLDEGLAPIVADGGRPILATRRIGSGTVYLSSAPDLLANGNLGAADNHRLVLNLLADLRPGSVIAFDEYHHGAHVAPSVSGLLLDTGPGRALLFVGVALFVYIALRGRRLGSPVPIEPRPARSSLDYVRSFAALLRRSRSGGLASERLGRMYRRRLARALGMRLGSEPGELVAGLARSEPDRAERVRAILEPFGRALPERDLIASVARAEALVREIERR